MSVVLLGMSGALLGFVLSALITAMWMGLHILTGLPWSPEAAQGLPLVFVPLGVIVGGVLAVIFD